MHWALIVYLIQIVVMIPCLYIMAYIDEKEDNNGQLGKRELIVSSICFSLSSFLPVLPIIVAIFFLFFKIDKKIKEWIKNDPTAPHNINQQQTVEEPQIVEDLQSIKGLQPVEFKKIKIDNRFEIMDLE